MKHLLFLSFLVSAPLVEAATLRVIVKDPSGAAIPEAAVTAQPRGGDAARKATNNTGAAEFSVEDGVYQVTVDAERFETSAREVKVKGDTEVTFAMKIAAVETTVDVGDQVSKLANVDVNYRALRDNQPGFTYEVKNLVLKRDTGTLTFRSGTIAFLKPILRRSAIAVFVGDGSFHFDTDLLLERERIKAHTGREQVDEDFDSAVLMFSDRTWLEVSSGQTQRDDLPAKLTDTLKRFRSRMRHRIQIPRSMMEAELLGSEIPNLEADLLGELYNPAQLGSFSAYIHGKKHADLRFLVRPLGAMPSMPSPEEVAVINVDANEETDGIWFLSHYIGEFKKGTASSNEVKRIVDAEHYKIETAIGKNLHLAAIADITLKARIGGVRVVPFGLLPNLRVSRVSVAGKDIEYIQEPRKSDGAFHVILPEALAKDQSVTVRVEYEGNRVIENSGGGTYAVGARLSWYPSLNAFQQQATYELTFKVPKNVVVVSVGKLVREHREGDVLVSEWKTETPVAVAGFNYGQYQKKSTQDEAIHYGIETFATREAPDFLKATGLNLAPSAMAESAMVDADNAMRVFTAWFGPAPYGRVAITQQPQFNFGQSWPTLVYLPVSAFLDSTQRYMLMGQGAFGFAKFIDEVTPHEVAHQWWGHMVGWATYHDQWLSEGFADFSAGIFLLNTDKKPDKFIDYWKRQQKQILEKNEYGKSANDAGPLWMGQRLNSWKNAGAYNRLIYGKGGYVLYMLRNLMYDGKTGDQDFIAMMKDFVQTNLYKAASLEDFMATVEKHKKPAMTIDGSATGGTDWFFRQWVMGKEIPRYHMDYSFDTEDGKTVAKIKLTQSDVSDGFFMRVPLYADFEGGHPMRIGAIPVMGSSTTQEFKVKLPKKPKKMMVNAYLDVLAREN